ncbi:MAG: hypothetical protein GY715_19850 [Planctomycetes bacterium]|nr:hypothetical protein [Planctomycetota bacterium]
MTTRTRLALLATLLLASCGDGGAADRAGTADGPESRVERGPVALTVRMERGEVTVGEKVALEIDVVADAGVEIVMPSIGETLGAFAVRDADTPPDVPEDTRRRWRHRYLLDTFAAGEAELPPVVLAFTDARPETVAGGADAIEGTLESEAIMVTVRSVLDADAPPEAFRDIRGELPADVFAPYREQQARRRWMTAGVVGAAVLLLGALGAWLVWRHARPVPPAPPIPADVWARGELDRLAADDLPSGQRFDEFYVRLSGIVREYIERRFSIMAPERTTDEFLAEARRSAALSDDHKTLLKSFLRAADMVKFARHLPTVPECETALASARGFVDQTRATPDTAVERAA